MTLAGHSPDCFVCGRLGVEVQVGDGEAYADLLLTDGVTGPASLIHGGVTSAIFDEVLGAAAGDAAFGAMTARLEVDYRRPWPLGEPARMTARAERVGERKLLVTGELTGSDGACLAEARGIWVVPRD